MRKRMCDSKQNLFEPKNEFMQTANNVAHQLAIVSSSF